MPTNVATLSRLLLAERPALVRWMTRIVGSHHAAEDVAQSLYVHVQRIADRPPVRAPRAFLFRLAGNLARDHARAARRQERVQPGGIDLTEVLSDEPSVERRLLDREKVARIAATVATLPPRCREVFVMVRLEDATVAEAAARLGISQDMVRKHVRLALTHCHAALARDDER